jgi:N-acetylneuraminic acid mutarotase
MGVERIAPTATLLLDGRVLVVKGTATASAEIYDPSSGNWVQTASANPSLVSHTATLLPNGTVLVAGGAEIRQGWTGAAIYDPANGTWLRASRLRVLQEYSSTATLLLDGRVFLAGGGTYDGQILADCELYLSR